MTAKNIKDAINRRTYASRSVVRWYRDLELINKVEEVILRELQPFIKGQKLLDIGIGGGRTTKYLVEISEDYTGVDYTLRLACIAKRKYPQATILCADARALPLADKLFDFALFSLNGIDYMDHADRIKALREIYRALKPGGIYVFSSHNRDYKGFRKYPWQENIPLTLGHAKSCLYALAHWPRHLMLRKQELLTDEYAIVNDSAHGFSLFTYYISIPQQIKQLAREGFTQLEAFDMEGNRINGDTDFPWTYYLARKPPAN